MIIMESFFSLQVDISSFSGKRLAIDASGWLHKAVFATTEDFIMHESIRPASTDFNCANSELFVDFFIHRVLKLQAHQIDLIVVFDGRRNALKVGFYLCMQ